KGQCAHPLTRVFRPEVSVADHARRMEVAQGYRAPVEPIVVLVLALLNRFIRRPIQLYGVEERCSLEPIAGDVTAVEGDQVTKEADGAVRIIKNQPDGDLALRRVGCRGLVEFLQ